MQKIVIDFECYDYNDQLYSGTMTATGYIERNTTTTDRGDLQDDAVVLEDFTLIGVLDDDGQEVLDPDFLESLSENVYFYYEQEMIDEILESDG